MRVLFLILFMISCEKETNIEDGFFYLGESSETQALTIRANWYNSQHGIYLNLSNAVMEERTLVTMTVPLRTEWENILFNSLSKDTSNLIVNQAYTCQVYVTITGSDFSGYMYLETAQDDQDNNNVCLEYDNMITQNLSSQPHVYNVENGVMVWVPFAANTTNSNLGVLGDITMNVQ